MLEHVPALAMLCVVCVAIAFLYRLCITPITICRILIRRKIRQLRSGCFGRWTLETDATVPAHHCLLCVGAEMDEVVPYWQIGDHAGDDEEMPATIPEPRPVDHRDPFHED